MMRPVLSREEYVKLRNGGNQMAYLKRIRGGEVKLKGELAQMNYSCLPNADGSLKGSKTASTSVGMDVDFKAPEGLPKAEQQAWVAERMAQVPALVLAKKDELGLLMLERSATKGFHLVFRRRPELSQEENLKWASDLLGVEHDKGAKDITRVFFTTTAEPEELIFLDDEVFRVEAAPEVDTYAAGTKAAGTKAAGTKAAGTKAADQTTPPFGHPSYSGGESSAADERTRFIFRECMKEEGVTERDLIDEGGRHNSVKIILSACTQLLTQGEVMGVLKEMMPDHWNDENIQSLVSDFYSKYYDPSQKLTMFQKRVFRESRKLDGKASLADDGSADTEDSAGETEPQSEWSKVFASKTPPELPATLPKLLKIITRNTPKIFKATVAQAIFPPLATYPRELSLLYTDNQTRELRICCLIVSGTGTGKDSCMRQPLEHVLAEMKKRDEINRKRLEKFNEEYSGKANNKEKPKRPTDLVIQTINSDITHAGLVQRMLEAQKAPLYVSLNELELWDKIEGKSGRSNQFTTMKLCDDESNLFGSDRAGTQSVTGTGNLHLNWNANTTPAKCLQYFKYVLTDGPVSRLCMATIPEKEVGSEDEVVFGTYDSQYDEDLKPYIDNLKAATGVIDCQQAKRMIKGFRHECAEFARLSQDRVFENLTRRGLVHVFRKACLLYVANGMKWEKAIETFCRWSLYYDIYLKMSLFGEQIRHADDDVPTSKRGPRNLLESIPTGEDLTFRYSDAVAARLKNGMKEDGTMKMLSQWKSRGHILQLTVDSFKKVVKT